MLHPVLRAFVGHHLDALVGRVVQDFQHPAGVAVVTLRLEHQVLLSTAGSDGGQLDIRFLAGSEGIGVPVDVAAVSYIQFVAANRVTGGGSAPTRADAAIRAVEVIQDTRGGE